MFIFPHEFLHDVFLLHHVILLGVFLHALTETNGEEEGKCRNKLPVQPCDSGAYVGNIVGHI